MPDLPPLTPRFTSTRGSLHQLACFVMAPARHARTGRIGLRPTGDGFGTPAFDDGTRILVHGDLLVVEGDGAARATKVATLRDGAAFVGVELSATPDVGRDLPPFTPDVPLDVDGDASRDLGAWYAFGAAALARIEGRGIAVSEPQLWPEHFDLAVVVTDPAGTAANVGFSPGDGFCEEPYAYVGPHELDSRRDGFWNAPFGAFRTRSELARGGADAFIGDGLARAWR